MKIKVLKLIALWKRKDIWNFWLYTGCYQWSLMQKNWDNLTKKNPNIKMHQYRIILQLKRWKWQKKYSVWIISILHYSQITTCQIEDARFQTPEKFNKSISTHWFISAFLSTTILVTTEEHSRYRNALKGESRTVTIPVQLNCILINKKEEICFLSSTFWTLISMNNANSRIAENKEKHSFWI